MAEIIPRPLDKAVESINSNTSKNYGKGTYTGLNLICYGSTYMSNGSAGYFVLPINIADDVTGIAIDSNDINVVYNNGSRKSNNVSSMSLNEKYRGFVRMNISFSEALPAPSLYVLLIGSATMTLT